MRRRWSSGFVLLLSFFVFWTPAGHGIIQLASARRSGICAGNIMITYTDLANELLRRLKNGQVQRVEHASPSQIEEGHSEYWKCHDNVNRWCQAHPEHRPARGWLVTRTEGGAFFDRHSVVDRGSAGLLDVTLLRDRSYSDFLMHCGDQEEFDALPNQVIAVDSAV